MNSDVLVSICCITYNHAPYIRQCLDGFIMQKTNFKFEILIHDDASTDGTADIIREYEAKFPNIIKPIYQTENQYSKGKNISATYNWPRSVGKYIAQCEGDDYWTDPLKLQKQVDFMEANPEYSMCFHKVNTLIQETGEIKNEFIVRDMPGKSTILDLAEGNYIHTPSVLYRRYSGVQEQYQKMMPCLPGDYVIWMLLAERGDIYKFDEPMAVYRYGSGLWSTSQTIKNDLAYLCTLNKLSVTISNDQARKKIQKQINDINTINFVVHMERELNQIRSSKAYRLGKMLLKPFKWLKKK